MEYFTLLFLSANTKTVYENPLPKPLPMAITGVEKGQTINDLGKSNCNN